MTTWTFDVPPELTVDLRVAIGRIQLVPTTAGRAEVTLDPSGPLATSLVEDSRVEVVGDRLVVHVPERGRRSRLRPRLGGTVHARIAVPDATALDADVAAADLDVTLDLRAVRVRSASGDVALRDVSGPVDVSSASGDLRVGGVDGGLKVSTAAGDVRAGDVEGDVAVRTASGDVRLGRAAGEVRVRSVSGDVAVREIGPGAADLASTSGDVGVGVAPGLEIHLDVASVTGELSSDLDGGGQGGGEVDLSLRARTVSGDVTISRVRTGGPASIV